MSESSVVILSCRCPQTPVPNRSDVCGSDSVCVHVHSLSFADCQTQKIAPAPQQRGLCPWWATLTKSVTFSWTADKNCYDISYDVVCTDISGVWDNDARSTNWTRSLLQLPRLHWASSFNTDTTGPLLQLQIQSTGVHRLSGHRCICRRGCAGVHLPVPTSECPLLTGECLSWP